MDDFERQWAVALKKGQLQNKQTNTVPLDVWKKQVQEEMDYFKTELKKYIQVKNIEKIEETLQKLFTLRAEQLAINIKNFEEEFGFTDKNYINKEIKKYKKDCNILVKATKTLLNK